MSHVGQCSGVTVCGIPAKEMQHEVEGERRYTLRVSAISDALATLVTIPDAKNIVLSGEISLEIGRPEPFTTSAVFGYQGLWKWGLDTHICQRLATDAGRHGQQLYSRHACADRIACDPAVHCQELHLHPRSAVQS